MGDKGFAGYQFSALMYEAGLGVVNGDRKHSGRLIAFEIGVPTFPLHECTNDRLKPVDDLAFRSRKYDTF